MLSAHRLIYIHRNMPSIPLPIQHLDLSTNPLAAARPPITNTQSILLSTAQICFFFFDLFFSFQIEMPNEQTVFFIFLGVRCGEGGRSLGTVGYLDGRLFSSSTSGAGRSKRGEQSHIIIM